MGRALRHREQLDMMGGVAPGALWFWWGVGLWGRTGGYGDMRGHGDTGEDWGHPG